MIDGTIARKMNTVTEFGARFDTAADFVFVVVCLIKLLPVISMPLWLCVWIAMIALIKIINIILGYIVQRKLVAIPVCAVATFAAVQEGRFIRTGREEEWNGIIHRMKGGVGDGSNA